MTAPPPMLARPPASAFQLPDFLRMPQWVYAGAASVAVTVLVALLSADASGLLSSDDAPRFQRQPIAVSQQIESQASESGPLTNVTRIEEQELTGTTGPPLPAAGDGVSQAAAPVAAQAPPVAAQAPTVVDQVPQAAQSSPQGPPQQAAAAPAAMAEPEQSLAAAPAQAPSNQRLAGEAVVEGEIINGKTTEEAKTERASAPIALSAEALPEQTIAEAVASEPSQEPTGTSGRQGDARPPEVDDASADLETPPSSQGEVEKIPSAAPVPTGVPQLQSKDTATAWRVLEGVAAFFGLISLIALGVRWRYSGR